MIVHLVVITLSDPISSQWEYSGNLGLSTSTEQVPEF